MSGEIYYHPLDLLKKILGEENEGKGQKYGIDVE